MWWATESGRWIKGAVGWGGLGRHVSVLAHATEEAARGHEPWSQYLNKQACTKINRAGFCSLSSGRYQGTHMDCWPWVSGTYDNLMFLVWVFLITKRTTHNKRNHEKKRRILWDYTTSSCLTCRCKIEPTCALQSHSESIFSQLALNPECGRVQ